MGAGIMDTVFKKYTLKEVKPIIEDLVKKYINFQDTADKLLEAYHKKYSQASIFNKDEDQAKDFEEWNKKWGDNPYFEELTNLTHWNTPVKNSKKCCRNCSYGICHLRDDKWHYCKDYNPRSWYEIPYIKPIFGKVKTPTLNQRITAKVNSYMKDYKKTLDYCDALEKEVPDNVITEPFSQEALDQEARFQKQQKEWWTRYSETFDHKEVTVMGDLKMQCYSPNKAKQKKLFEETKMCSMTAAAKDLGLMD